MPHQYTSAIDSILRQRGPPHPAWACLAASFRPLDPWLCRHVHTESRRCQAARDYGALPDAEAVRLARSGEGAGRMPLSAEMLEKLLPRDGAPRAPADEQVLHPRGDHALLSMSSCCYPQPGHIPALLAAHVT